MLLETLSTSFRKARSVNQTSTSFVAKIPTVTEPKGDIGTNTGASVIELGNYGGATQNGVLACFYGVGSNNNTFSARIIGWRSIGENAVSTMLWVPVLLAEYAVILSSTYPGIAGKTIVATEFFADTITLTYGNANVSEEIVSPTADAGIAHVVADIKGFQKLEFAFAINSGSATDCNALLSLF